MRLPRTSRWVFFAKHPPPVFSPSRGGTRRPAPPAEPSGSPPHAGGSAGSAAFRCGVSHHSPRRLFAALSFVLASALAASAAAQPAASEDDKRAAKELANKGFEQYEAGEYARAIPLFHLAATKYPAPTILLVEARSQEKVGGFVEAQGLYQRIVDMQLAPDAPKEFVDAQASAKTALPEVSERIAFVKIVLKGMTADRVHVTIDDVEIAPDKLLQPIPQNPGTHKVVATIGGDETGRSVFQSVTLKERVTKQITLVFRPGGTISAETPPSSGGCASCEIGTLRGGSDAPAALLAAAALALATAARRRRSRA